MVCSHSTVPKIISRSRIEWSRTCRYITLDVLLKNNVLDLYCRTSNGATKVENKLCICKVNTLDSLHLIFELLVCCHSVCILKEEYIIVVLLSKLDGYSCVICCRVEYELEVISIVC